MSLNPTRDDTEVSRRHRSIYVAIPKLTTLANAREVAVSLIANLKRISCMAFLDKNWKKVRECDAVRLTLKLNLRGRAGEEVLNQMVSPSLPSLSGMSRGVSGSHTSTQDVLGGTSNLMAGVSGLETPRRLRSSGRGLTYIAEGDERNETSGTGISSSSTSTNNNDSEEKDSGVTGVSTNGARTSSSQSRVGSSGMTPIPFPINSQRERMEVEGIRQVVNSMEQLGADFARSNTDMPRQLEQEHSSVGNSDKMAFALIDEAIASTYVWVYISGEWEPQAQRDSRMYVYGKLEEAVSAYSYLTEDLIQGDVLALFLRIMKAAQTTELDLAMDLQQKLFAFKKTDKIPYAVWYNAFAKLVLRLRHTGMVVDDSWVAVLLLTNVRNDAKYADVVKELRLTTGQLSLTQIHQRLELEANWAGDIQKGTHGAAFIAHAEDSDDGNTKKKKKKKRRDDKIGKCFYFERHGNCRYGDKCRFEHIGDSSSKKSSTSTGKSNSLGVGANEYFDNMSLSELLNLFSALYGSSNDPMELLNKVNLGDKANAKANELSGGQKQRFSIACALVNNPLVLFLDEPTTGLDPQAKRSLWDLVLDLNKMGMTIVLTTFIACCGITCTIQSFFCEKRQHRLLVCRPNLRFNNTTNL